MTELQLSLLFRYIDSAIEAAIQHEIGGESLSFVQIKEHMRNELIKTITEPCQSELKLTL